MKKLLCLMIVASLFTVSAEASSPKPADAKAVKPAVTKTTKSVAKKKAAPAKTANALTEESRSRDTNMLPYSTKTPLYGWHQDSKAK